MNINFNTAENVDDVDYAFHINACIVVDGHPEKIAYRSDEAVDSAFKGFFVALSNGAVIEACIDLVFSASAVDRDICISRKGEKLNGKILHIYGCEDDSIRAEV